MGTVWINDYHPYVPQAEWGGYKQSGHRPRARRAPASTEYRETKHVWHNIRPAEQRWFAGVVRIAGAGGMSGATGTTSSSWAAARPAARWPTGSPPTPAPRVLVLEAGRSDYRIDPFIHMPAALPFPIGNRFYDWKYETDPEPHMNGRRVFHARGKVLGGSSSINGMIFQRGNPMDYERWAAEPGHEGVGLRPLPALLQADGDLPAPGADDVARRRRPAGARAGPGREPALRCVLPGRRRRPATR